MGYWNGPEYLRDIHELYKTNRSLCFVSPYMITHKEPRTKLTTAGDRRFYSSSPKLWNRLPTEIQNSHTFNLFKTKLKLTSSAVNTINWCTILGLWCISEEWL